MEFESRANYLSEAQAELQEELESKTLPKLLPEAQSVTISTEKLYKSVPEDAMVIHISVGHEGLLILCISSQGIVDVHSDEMTDLDLNRHILLFVKLFRNLKSGQTSNLPSLETCEEYLKPVTDAIIGPIKHFLVDKEHVIFVPTPSLNKFPLSALTYNIEPIFLNKDVSQVPSLSSLSYLVEKETTSRFEEIRFERRHRLQRSI